MIIGGPRINWNEIKDKIDLAAVVTRLLGPPGPKRARPPPLVVLPVPRGP